MARYQPDTSRLSGIVDWTLRGSAPFMCDRAPIFFNVTGAATVVAKARALWRSGWGLLRAAAIAALVLVPLRAAHSQDGALETRKEEPSIDWFFRERPLPSQFVQPVGEATCAVTKVTATERVRFAARRHGGDVALSVELQARENVETLAISKSQILRAQFYRTAPQRLPDRLKDRGEPGAVDTHFLQMPMNEGVFVFLCRIDGGYYLSYSLNID